MREPREKREEKGWTKETFRCELRYKPDLSRDRQRVCVCARAESQREYTHREKGKKKRGEMDFLDASSLSLPLSLLSRHNLHHSIQQQLKDALQNRLRGTQREPTNA
jgi:hypothetical protein